MNTLSSIIEAYVSRNKYEIGTKEYKQYNRQFYELLEKFEKQKYTEPNRTIYKPFRSMEPIKEDPLH
jgi:hypothetical protein